MPLGLSPTLLLALLPYPLGIGSPLRYAKRIMPISFKIGPFGSWVGIPLGRAGVSGGIIIRARIIRLRSRSFLPKEGKKLEGLSVHLVR